MNITIPSTMRVMAIGDDAALHARTQNVPEYGANDVLIKVAYAALNRADIFQKHGSYPPPDDIAENIRDVPGLEISGIVVALGENTQHSASHSAGHFAIGDKMCALLSGGGYAEYVSVPAALCLPVPEKLSLKQAACIPEAFATSWLALHELANIQPHETLLVHGGSSGVGIAAIQIAQHLGAEVFATVRTAEKAAHVAALGATAIRYDQKDFVETIAQKATGGKVDVVLDMVGGSYIQRNIKALRMHGRYISIAFMQGAHAELSMGGLLLKNLSWHGMTLRSRTESEKAALLHAMQSALCPLFTNGTLAPLIDTVFGLSHAEKAHRHMEECLHSGKILLQIDT